MAHYLAVRCQKNPQHIILLCRVELNSDGDALKDSRYTVSPFEAECSQCKERQQFGGFQVMLVEDLSPNENFQDHPTFR